MKLLEDIFGAAQEISPFIFAIRSIVVGILLYIEGKVLPYRAGGQFAGFDFAFFWMMGGITAAPLLDSKISFINTVVIVIVIYTLHYIISYFAVNNRTFANIVLGKPIPLISGGKIIRPNMAKALLPLELLLSDMRNIGAPNINEVEAAILETSGHVSILKKSDYEPVTAKDLNIHTMGAGLPTLLINDGKVVDNNLKKLGYDEEWLKDELLKKGISNINNIYAAMIDTSGEVYYPVKIQK